MGLAALLASVAPIDPGSPASNIVTGSGIESNCHNGHIDGRLRKPLVVLVEILKCMRTAAYKGASWSKCHYGGSYGSGRMWESCHHAS